MRGIRSEEKPTYNEFGRRNGEITKTKKEKEKLVRAATILHFSYAYVTGYVISCYIPKHRMFDDPEVRIILRCMNVITIKAMSAVAFRPPVFPASNPLLFYDQVVYT